MSTTPTPNPTAPDWYAETPIFIEALADASHSEIDDVCTILDDTMSGNNVSDSFAVKLFIDDYIIDDAA